MVTFRYPKAFQNITLFAACIFLVGSVIVDLLSTTNWQLAHYPNDLLPFPISARNSKTTHRSSIGKVTMVYGDTQPVFERGLRLHEHHNRRFGYSMFVLRQQTMPDYWSKPAHIMKVLLSELEKPEGSRLKWLVWFDADIVLMNSQIPLEIFLPPGEKWSNITCLVTNDFHGLNTGVMFLKVDPWSVWLISAVMSLKIYHPSFKLRFADQSAMEELLATDRFMNQTRHVPQRWFNAYPGDRGTPDPMPNVPMQKFKPASVKEGDLLVHFPAHYEIRARRMTAWLDVAEQHLRPWEVSLDQTTYPAEIQQYWERDAPGEVDFLLKGGQIV